MIEFTGLIATFGALKQAAGVLIDARDAEKLSAAKLEFMERLAEANIQLLQVLDVATQQAVALGAANEHLRELQAGQRERAGYQLAEVVTGRGFFGYRPGAGAEAAQRGDEPVHFLCQPCFDAGRKAVLNHNGDGHWWCPVCKHGAQLMPARPLPGVGRRSGTFEDY